jgi:hypothetical protein
MPEKWTTNGRNNLKQTTQISKWALKAIKNPNRHIETIEG